MAKTVVAVYNDFQRAVKVVDALQDSGFDRADISVIANDASGAYADYLRKGESLAVTNPDDVTAGEGAGFGALVGALTGIVVGLGALAIPGLGPVIAGGPIIAALASGTIGAAAGALTGGVIAALVDLGVDPVDASIYAEGIRRGGTMIAVKTRDDNAQTAARIMQSGQPIDLDASVNRWREQGWERYVEGDEPVAPMDVNPQRDLVPSRPSAEYPSYEAHIIRVYGYNLED